MHAAWPQHPITANRAFELEQEHTTMLQTLNIPSCPLPEVPSAPPGAPGDAGERAEFAQLLQQAKASDTEGAHDAPTVMSAKDARIEPRTRPGTPRAAHDHQAHDHKAHDTRHRADAEATDTEAIDVAACMKQAPLTDALAVATDEAQVPHTPKPDDGAASSAADATLAVLLQANEALPAQTLPSAGPPASDERGAAARLHQRPGARDMRLPARAEDSAIAAADDNAARTDPSNDITLPSKDGAFDLALRQAAGGRSTAAPLFDRTPLESTPAAAQAAAFARELQHPLATRADAVAQASLRAAPDEAGFAPALGTQVALWVKNGVQEARLQLHPAELGPVSVQIALVGQAAHIDFTATVAATRESIEQSLPALAAALRESGFTLAGGGVFGRSGQGANDSSRDRTPEGRGQGLRGTAAIGADGAEEMPPLQPRRGRSLVDLYA
jgi:flagellar hook-length control protein FliK